jgi:predicted RNA-binding protein Jag
VDEAMAKITSGEVEEVFLKPMNSFYRRIQHQYAVDKGFESCSVGEGNERGVKVSKKL